MAADPKAVRESRGNLFHEGVASRAFFSPDIFGFLGAAGLVGKNPHCVLEELPLQALAWRIPVGELFLDVLSFIAGRFNCSYYDNWCADLDFLWIYQNIYLPWIVIIRYISVDRHHRNLAFFQ